jgi:hypothetical protein
MGRPEQSPEKKALQECWGRWTAIVELFARRRLARRHVDHHAYLVQPWLNLTILARGERDILFDLLIRCHHVRTQLGGHSWIHSVRAYGIPILIGVLFFTLILLCTSTISVPLRTILTIARNWSDDLYIRAIHSSDLERLFCVGFVLIAISIYAVSRTAKS